MLLSGTRGKPSRGSRSVLSDAATITDGISKQIDWEKLAARAGFEDGVKAREHYEILLKPRETASDPAKKRQGDDADAHDVDNCYNCTKPRSTPAMANIST